jgi:hypothetical protein
MFGNSVRLMLRMIIRSIVEAARDLDNKLFYCFLICPQPKGDLGPLCNMLQIAIHNA